MSFRNDDSYIPCVTDQSHHGTVGDIHQSKFSSNLTKTNDINIKNKTNKKHIFEMQTFFSKRPSVRIQTTSYNRKRSLTLKVANQIIPMTEKMKNEGKSIQI